MPTKLFLNRTDFLVKTWLLNEVVLFVVVAQSLSSVSLRPHGLQHTRLPCPSISPRVCLNSSIESVMPSNHLILCRPLLLLPSIFPSIRVFSNDLALYSQSIAASALVSVFPMNIQGWFPLGLTGLVSLLSRGLKSLLQHHSSKVSILWHSVFFMVQLSHPSMTTGKTIALIRWAFVCKVMSLFLICFSPKKQASFHGCSHHLQWFWSPTI